MDDKLNLFGKSAIDDNEIDVDSDREFHQTIMDTYNDSIKVWEEIRNCYEEGIRFALYGDQWSEAERSKRSATGRTVTTTNKLAANIRYVVNNFISNPPSIKIHPQGSNANKNTAEILDGIIKYIQYNSDATEAYANALRGVCAGGLGAWRVIPRSCEYDSSKIELVVERVRDVLTVVVDPNAKNPNFSDMEFCFITNRISKHQFDREFPEFKDSAEDTIDGAVGWGDKEFVQVAEFWRKVNGKVEQYLFNGSKILYSNTDYPGKLIPIIFCVGEDISIGKDRKIKSLISDVIDQQKILNYTKSEIVDSIQKTTKTKMLVDYNTISNPELQRMWNTANSEAYPYMPYDGKAGIKPDQINPGSIPTAYLEGGKEAMDDIQFGMGIPNPTTDIPTSQSGKAISLQLSQKNLQTYNFINNINLGIRYTGEILLDLIQHYYDESDIMQILGLDGQVTQVPVNDVYQENGKDVYHDLTKSAEYKCMVSIGPSYTDKRQEMLDTLTSMSQQMPIIGATAADLIISHMDFDNSDAISKRIRAGMDPKIVAASNPTNGDDESIKANLQALQNQDAQNQQVIAQLQNELKAAQDANQLRIQLDQMKYQHEAEMEVMRTKFKRESEVQKMQIDEQKAQKDMELDAQKEIIKSQAKTEDNKQKLAHDIAAKQHDYTLDIHKADQKHQQNLELEMVKKSVG
jgi:hypothetical protein